MSNSSFSGSLSNPLLHSYLPKLTTTRSTTILNYNLKPKPGLTVSEPMPVYQLASFFPPSDKFPYQTSDLSPRSSLASFHFSPSRINEPAFPISSSETLVHCIDKLTVWEMTEVMGYSEVFYIGSEAEKVTTTENPKNNFGYDDDSGRYKVIIKDHIGYRYEICKIYGLGTFGVVVKALDHKEKKYVALKINDFNHSNSQEVEILQFLKDKGNKGSSSIVEFYGSFVFRKHTIIIFEILTMNLYEFLKSSKFSGISNNLIRRIASQILQGLDFLHRFSVIHCDLKPENILFKDLNRSIVKIVDFGTSFFEGQFRFGYFQSRYYRAPEAILGLKHTTAIDMWSFGCILAELHTGTAIFCGDNEIDQFFSIMEYCEPPPSELILLSKKWKLYFDSKYSVKLAKNARGVSRAPKSKDLSGFLSGADKSFVDLVRRCLQTDPLKRITAKEARGHPWILDVTLKAENKSRALNKRKLSLGVQRIYE